MRRSVFCEMINQTLTMDIDSIHGATASVGMVMPRMVTQVTLERVRRGGGYSIISGNGNVSRCHVVRSTAIRKGESPSSMLEVVMMQLWSSGGCGGRSRQRSALEGRERWHVSAIHRHGLRRSQAGVRISWDDPDGGGLIGASAGKARPGSVSGVVILPGCLARTSTVIPAGSGARSPAGCGGGAIVSRSGGRGVAVRGFGDDGGVAGRRRPPAIVIRAGAGRSAIAAHDAAV